MNNPFLNPFSAFFASHSNFFNPPAQTPQYGPPNPADPAPSWNIPPNLLPYQQHQPYRFPGIPPSQLHMPMNPIQQGLQQIYGLMQHSGLPLTSDGTNFAPIQPVQKPGLQPMHGGMSAAAYQQASPLPPNPFL